MTPHEESDLSLIADQKKSATHGDLCDAAVRWLYGTAGCNVALSGISSAREIPDAIGWSTASRIHCGSIVVECKVSVSDFHANKYKEHGNRMGNFRYFLVPDGLIPLAKVWDGYPSHGLLYYRRKRVSVIQKAKDNESPDLLSENRLLQFAVLHIRENLLGVGCAVDMNTLTKAYMSNRARNGWYGDREFGYGVELPCESFTFNKGECR